MDHLNFLIDNYNIPILTAFLLGVLTSISPCPLATNITAIAYVAKKLESPKQTIFSGIAYTLGRGTSYVVLATLIYYGLSSLKISNVFQGWGDKLLGPILIFIALVMLDVIKININSSSNKIEKLKLWLVEKGHLGSFLLGMIFALAFCPYSGVLFFGGLVPLVLKAESSLFLPIFFAVGTGLPVIIFSLVIVFSIQKMSILFTTIQKIEKIMRYVVAVIFLGVGLYYLQYLVKIIS